MVAVKSPLWSPGLASVNVAPESTLLLAAPSVPPATTCTSESTYVHGVTHDAGETGAALVELQRLAVGVYSQRIVASVNGRTAGQQGHSLGRPAVVGQGPKEGIERIGTGPGQVGVGPGRNPAAAAIGCAYQVVAEAVHRSQHIRLIDVSRDNRVLQVGGAAADVGDADARVRGNGAVDYRQAVTVNISSVVDAVAGVPGDGTVCERQDARTLPIAARIEDAGAEGTDVTGERATVNRHRAVV